VDVTGVRALDVEDTSQVAAARRAAVEVATGLELDETASGRVALLVTELATNLVKHARGGQIIVGPSVDRAEPGVEILALDRGPGMNVAQCLRDGFSTTGSPGSGLGAVRRLADAFDVYSRPERGTALFARVACRQRRPPAHGVLEVAGLAVCKPGEPVCGDGWAQERRSGGVTILVVDGLGHGPGAAEVATQAVHTFHAHPNASPRAHVENIHAALRATRGAAVAVADLDLGAGVVRFSGVGNIAALIVHGHKPRHLVSHNGTAGTGSPRITEFTYPWFPGALLVMHSDGVATIRDLATHPGVTERHPRLVAGVLYRDYRRGSDDATVVVAAERAA
jgi:anti-sigma regulatory factor (Ser/Thr protein kinase)